MTLEEREEAHEDIHTEMESYRLFEVCVGVVCGAGVCACVQREQISPARLFLAQATYAPCLPAMRACYLKACPRTDR